MYFFKFLHFNYKLCIITLVLMKSVIWASNVEKSGQMALSVINDKKNKKNVGLKG